MRPSKNGVTAFPRMPCSAASANGSRGRPRPARIRAVIEDDPKNPKRVLTVRGTGYRFRGA